MTPHLPKILYRVTDAAEMLSISRSSIYAKMAAGEIRSVTVGRRRLIPADALVEFAARLGDSDDAA